MKKLFVEINKQYFCGHVIASELRPATSREIKGAKIKYKNTKKCKCELIYDEAGYMYDVRTCGICGAFVDLI